MRLNAVFYSLAGLLFVVVSLPLILERVGPNRWYGLRVEKTLADERIWYAANKVLGYDLLVAGAVIFLTPLVTSLVDRQRPIPVNKINLFVFIAALAAAVLHSLAALRRM